MQASSLPTAQPQPELVSQRTSEAVLSIPRRTFLEALPAFEAHGGRVLRLGRLRLVDRVAFVGWLETRENKVGAQPIDGDGLAAALGLRLVGGSR